MADDYNELEDIRNLVQALRTKTSRLEERVDELEQENIELRAQLESDRNTQPGSKQARAKRLARNECLRQLATGVERHAMSGETKRKETAFADVPTIQEQSKANGDEYAYNTVKRAIDALADEWDCFETKAGSGSPSGKNYRLVVPRDEDVPAKLWTAYHDDTGSSVPAGATDTVVSNSAGGGD